jgi:uncharacterized protein YndB with AHSA1/START domain
MMEVDSMQTLNDKAVEVKAEMLIRKPVVEVFEAFANPEITSKFWFTKGSGRLEPGARVRWDWEMYGVSTEVEVKEVEQNKRILIEWEGYGGARETVEWVFTPRAKNETFVSITNRGFSGSGDEIVRYAVESMGGFTIVLCGLKAWLEHHIRLNLIADKAPDAIVKR